MRLLSVVLLSLLHTPSLWASDTSLTLFLDGAREERELAARKGYLEVTLPATMLPNTLRVRPLGECEVIRVQLVPVARDLRMEKERAVLEERRSQLQDRLKVLDEREEIFRAAAKSQSGKALRKTKTNPEPLETVRKGTDFALGQLESVHISRRKAERELAVLESKIVSQRKSAAAAGVARVWLSKPDSRVRIAFLLDDVKWIPWYEFRLAGTGSAETLIRAKLPTGMGKASLSVSLLTLSEAYGNDIVSYPVSGDLSPITSFRLSLAKEELTRGPVSYLSFTLTNTTGKNLPAGEVTGYWQGEYLGRTVFGGCRPNESRALVIGK